MTLKELDSTEKYIEHIASWWALLANAMPEDRSPTQADTDIQSLIEMGRELVKHARELQEKSYRMELITRQAILVAYSYRDDGRTKEWLTDELGRLQDRVRKVSKGEGDGRAGTAGDDCNTP